MMLNLKNHFDTPLLHIALWLVFWITAGLVVYGADMHQQPEIFVVMGSGAILSLVPMITTLNTRWQGLIVDIQLDARAYNDKLMEAHRYAYIRQPDGQILRLDAAQHWQIGDRLEKRRGEAHVRVMSEK